MKKLALLIGIIVILSSCAQDAEKVQAEREAVYFLNENFVLVDAKEEIISDGGVPYIVRTWVVNRVIQHSTDSIEQGIIVSKINANTNNCDCDNDFVITNELWYSKPIGSTLHFEFIRKDRFFKMQRRHEENMKQEAINNPTKNNMTGMSKMDVELKILSLEREIIMLQEQLKTFN